MLSSQQANMTNQSPSDLACHRHHHARASPRFESGAGLALTICECVPRPRVASHGIATRAGPARVLVHSATLIHSAEPPGLSPVCSHSLASRAPAQRKSHSVPLHVTRLHSAPVPEPSTLLRAAPPSVLHTRACPLPNQPLTSHVLSLASVSLQAWELAWAWAHDTPSQRRAFLLLCLAQSPKRAAHAWRRPRVAVECAKEPPQPCVLFAAE